MKRVFLICIVMALCLFCAFSEECGHKWKYTNNGESSHTAVCTLCKETRSDTHNLSMSRTNATCQAPATVKYECALCSYVYSYTEGEKNPGHAFGEYTIVRRASCRQTGLNSRTCPDCGKVETLEIDTLDHDYGAWQQYDEKWHIRYCKDCNWAYKGSHRLNDGEITVHPTESQLGLIRYTCRVCKDTFENILRMDGAIYAIDKKDVLGNGTSYLLAVSKDEENARITNIALSGGEIDLRPESDCEIDVYANAKTGNYAGISVESGKTAIDIIPKADNETANLEFLLLKKNTSADIRIFNAAGGLEIENLNGTRLILAQAKTSENKVVTLLMRITEKRDSIELEAQMHLADTARLTISNENSNYTFTFPENSKKIASVTFKYQRNTGKITVSPRNHENTANGIVVTLLEGTEILRSAENTKTAEAYVQLSSDSALWRLRASFPMGFTLETPLFRKDGSYAGNPIRFLMDETALHELMNIDPMPEIAKPETPEIQLPEINEQPPSDAPSDIPPANEAPLPAEDTYTLNAGDSKTFPSPEHPSIVVNYVSGKFTVTQSGDADDWKIKSVTLVQKGGAFRILNAYSLPAEFEASGGTVTLRVQLSNGSDTKEVSLGTYVFQ